MKVPWSPYSQFGTSMMKKPETILQPGLVRRICSAGRRVFAVEWQAPETSPSASFSLSIMTPKVVLSLCRVSLAFSGVMPFFLRSS